MGTVCAVVIGDSGGKNVTIRANSRAHGDCGDFWDGNWIEAEVSIDMGASSSNFLATFRAEEFAAFFASTRALHNSLKGESVFETMEGQLSLKLVGDGRGHIRVVGESVDQVGIGNRLSFGFEIDQTYLKRILSDLGSLVEAFPIIGTQDT
jgi:hypothetical protein